MKRLILLICLAVVVVAAAVLLIVYRTPSATSPSADVAREAGAITGDLAGSAESEGDEPIEAQGEGPVGEDDVSAERDAPPGAPAESQQRTSPQTDTSKRNAPTPDSARGPRPDMGGPGAGDGEGMPDRPAMRPGRFMERIDTNGDGKISKAEWKKHYDEAFAQADKNSDGYIESDEMSSGFRPPGGMGPGGRRRGEGPGSGSPPGGIE